MRPLCRQKDRLIVWLRSSGGRHRQRERSVDARNDCSIFSTWYLLHHLCTYCTTIVNIGCSKTTVTCADLRNDTKSISATSRALCEVCQSYEYGEDASRKYCK